MESSTKGGGIGLGDALLIVFIVLKLTGTIDWSWWWVLSPMWIPIAFIAAFFGVVALVAFIASALDR